MFLVTLLDPAQATGDTKTQDLDQRPKIERELGRSIKAFDRGLEAGQWRKNDLRSCVEGTHTVVCAYAL